MPTGLTLGDGGMAKPSLGVRAPPGRTPRTGRSGPGDDAILGTRVAAGGVPPIGMAAMSREAVETLSRL